MKRNKHDHEAPYLRMKHFGFELRAGRCIRKVRREYELERIYPILPPTTVQTTHDCHVPHKQIGVLWGRADSLHVHTLEFLPKQPQYLEKDVQKVDMLSHNTEPQCSDRDSQASICASNVCRVQHMILPVKLCKETLGQIPCASKPCLLKTKRRTA